MFKCVVHHAVNSLRLPIPLVDSTDVMKEPKEIEGDWILEKIDMSRRKMSDRLENAWI